MLAYGMTTKGIDAADRFEFTQGARVDARLFDKVSIKRVLSRMFIGIAARVESFEPLAFKRPDMKWSCVNTDVFIIRNVCVYI